MSNLSGSGGGVIGSPIIGGTAKSVLYVGTNGVLAQDNTNFQYDSSTQSLLITGTTAAAPGYSVYAGTGMYHVGTGLLGFATNSTLVLSIDTQSRLGILTTNATHSLTIGSTATGIAAYNTVDTSTNYERYLEYWSGNEYQITTGKGGTGANRGIRISAGGPGGLADILVGFGGANSMYFNTQGLSRLYISNSATAGIANYYPIVGDATYTTGGTTGNQTINKPAGSVNFAGGASTLTVTNSMCTANSIVTCVVMTNDTTATIKNVVPASGSFVITLTAAATAETRVGFILG